MKVFLYLGQLAQILNVALGLVVGETAHIRRMKLGGNFYVDIDIKRIP